MEQLRNECDVGCNPRLPATVKSLKLQVRRHEEVDELRVCSRPCSTGIDVGSDVVDLFAVLLYDDAATGGAGVSREYYTVAELEPDDGGAGLAERGLLNDLALLHEFVPVWWELSTSG